MLASNTETATKNSSQVCPGEYFQSTFLSPSEVVFCAIELIINWGERGVTYVRSNPSLTSVQVNSDCIIPVNHLHLEFRERRQQGGRAVCGGKAEGGLIGVGVHHPLRIYPEPCSAHISLVLGEDHLGHL